MEAILGSGGNNPNGGEEPQTDEPQIDDPLIDDPREIPPEEMDVQDRWYTWEADDATATVTHSVADDGVCTIVVGGTAERHEDPDWNRWKATANYSYTVKANTVYEYKFEAWTDGDDDYDNDDDNDDYNRYLDIAYYNEYDGDGTVLQFYNFKINSTRKTYTMIGGKIPKDRIASLEFHCADKTGEFYVNVLSITPSRNDFGVANLTQWNAAVSEINSNDAGVYIIDIVADFGMNGVTANTFGESYIDVTINGGSHTIALTGTGSLLRIGSNQTVTMRDLTLRGDTSNNASLVYVGGGTFNMESSSAITGNKASQGGGVFVTNYGTFNMNGGSISSNTADYGGGVYNSVGTFNMKGGEVSSNTATTNGGGVLNNNIFNMSGNAKVSSNTATTSGGGVYIYSGTFNMEGGEISNNQANSTADGGGGVFIANSANAKFTMLDGIISGNSAANGGGVMTMASGTFLIVKGTVYGTGEGALSNNATTNGAALYNPSSATAQHGTFSGTGGAWVSAGNLSTRNETIKVENGVLQ